MTYFWKLCDETMNSLSKYKHFNSKTRTSFSNSIIGRFIIPIPSFNENDALLRKYVIEYIKNLKNLKSDVFLMYQPPQIVLDLLEWNQNQVCIIPFMFQ